MNQLRITLLLALITTSSHGQIDSTDFKQRYQKDVIYLSVPGYIKNDKRFSKLHLKTEFDFSSEGSKIFKLHQEDATKSFLCISFTFIFFGATSLADNLGYTKLAEVFSYASLVPIAISIPFAIRSNKRMKRAVWLRNRDVLLN